MKILLSLSGGVDSTTLLAHLLAEEYEVEAVSFFYASKHNAFENSAAARIAGYYKVPNTFIDLSGIMNSFKSNLMLHGGDIPEGHYTDESMSQTVVPARNIIFLSILSGLAWSKGISEIAIGVHQGDHAIYPDCRIPFLTAMEEAIRLGTDGYVELTAPFLRMNKIETVRRGLELGVPYELTRTCYKNQPIACGKCGACVERLEAFKRNGLEDPIPYENKT